MINSEFITVRRERWKKLLAVGDAIIGNGLSNSKTAALTIIASTMINHDEAYTKR